MAKTQMNHHHHHYNRNNKSIESIGVISGQIETNYFITCWLQPLLTVVVPSFFQQTSRISVLMTPILRFSIILTIAFDLNGSQCNLYTMYINPIFLGNQFGTNPNPSISLMESSVSLPRDLVV